MLAREGESLNDRLRTIIDAFRATPLREALRVASPTLASALEHTARVDEDPARVGLALMRYVERMRGRATPFGLCAGYSVGRMSKETSPLTLEPVAKYRKIARLDVDVVSSVVKKRAQEQASDQEELIATRELLRLPNTLRLARRGADGNVAYEDIARSATLDLVLEAAKEPRTRTELLAVLEPFGEEAERRGFVQVLLSHGLLVPASLPPLTTRAEVPYLGRTHLAELAESIRDQPIGADTDETHARLEEELGPFRSSESERTVIFDLVKPLKDGTLGEDVVRECAKLVSVLARLGSPARDTRLTRLRTFLESHYEGRDAPLVEALDPDRGFEFPVLSEHDYRDESRRTQTLQCLHERALREGLHEVELTEADLPKGEVKYPRDAFAARFSLALSEQGPELWDLSLVPAPGTQLFARATAFDDELFSLTRSYLHAQADAFPRSDIADVAYFVPGKSASFVQLPPLQPFEIPLTAQSGVPDAQRIDVNDLLIRFVGDDIVITSEKTGRRVRPRTVGAVNANRPDVTSIARFLHALGGEDALPGVFHWGSLEHASFLPRVRSGRHVLSRASWNLRDVGTARIRKTKDHDAAFELVQMLRHQHRLPRHVLYHEAADLYLPVDLDDRLSVAAWLDVARERMRLIEAHPLADGALRGPEGTYHHEIVVPFLPRGPLEPDHAAQPIPPSADRHDRRAPGGDVLFLKLYGDRHELVSLVTDTLRTLIVDAREEGLVTHWFFLPYADPDPHLRLRFFGRPEALWGSLLPRVHAALQAMLDTRTLHRVVIDTYDRETYRYGGPGGLDIVEHIFCASSEAAIVFHDATPLKEYEENRLMIQVVTSHLHLLAAAGFTLEEQAAQAKLTATRYQRVANPARARRRAGEIFREIRPALEQSLSEGSPWPEDIERSLATQFAALKGCEGLTSPVAEIIADCMHVHSIRLLTIWHETPDTEEMVYLILEKVLRGSLARRSKT